MPYYMKVPKRISLFKSVKYENKYLQMEKLKTRRLKNIVENDKIFEEDYSDVTEDKTFSENSYLGVIPEEEPASIMFARYLTEDTVWIVADNSEAGFVYEYVLGEESPTSYHPVCDAENEPITCHLSLFDGEYLALAFKNGRIRIVKANKENWYDFSNYCEVSTHNSSNGFITCLCTSYDSKYLFSSGLDGNVVAYRVNIDLPKYNAGSTHSLCSKYKQKLAKYSLPPDIEIDDYIPIETPSIQKSRIEKTLSKLREDKKKNIKQEMKQLRNDYLKILKLNEKLPPEERFSKNFFKMPQFESEMAELENKTIKQVKKKYNREFYRIEQLLNNLKTYFVQDLQTHLVHLIGIKHNFKVTTYRTCNFDDFFLEVEKEVTEAVEKENKLENIFKSYGQSNKEKKPAIESSPPLKPKRTELDRYITDYNDCIQQFGPEKMKYFQQLLKDREEMMQLKKKLGELYKIPKQNLLQVVEDEIDVEMNKESNKTKKKTNFTNNPTKERLTYCLIKCLRYICGLKEEFNKKALKARDLKLEVMYDYNLAVRDSNYIAREMQLPFEFEIPPEPPFDRFLEFPESYTKETEAIYLPDSPAPPIPDKWEEEFDYIYCNRDPEEFMGEPFDNKFSNQWTEYLLNKGMTLKQISKRMKRFQRFTARLNEIGNIDAKLLVYDNLVEKLAYEKFVIDEKITKVTFLTTSLYQELFIVRFYAILGDKLMEKMTPFIKKKHVFILKLLIEEKKLKTIKKASFTAMKRSLSIESEVIHTLPPQSPYLKRMRNFLYSKSGEDVPSNIKDNISLASSKSISPNDDDSDDSDSEDFSQQELFDENNCPAGLDRQIFETIVELKAQRDKEEKAVNQFKQMEEEKIELINYYQKRKKMCDVIIAIYYSHLFKYKEEKEEQISQLNVTFIMRPCEIQCFNKETNKIDDNPIFTTIDSIHKHEIESLSKEKDIDFTKKQLRKLMAHLKRMLSDIKYLSEKKKKLKTDIDDRMMARFGTMIDVQEMVEYAIKSLIQSQKGKSNEMKTKLKSGFVVLEKKLYEKTTDMLEATRENTNKMHIACALLEEKNKMLQLSLKKKPKSLFNKKQLEEDIISLKETIKREEDRKRFLLKAILHFKTKGELYTSDEEETSAQELEEKEKKKKRKKKTKLTTKEKEAILARMFNLVAPDDVVKSEEKRLRKQMKDIFDVELSESELTTVKGIREVKSEEESEDRVATSPLTLIEKEYIKDSLTIDEEELFEDQIDEEIRTYSEEQESEISGLDTDEGLQVEVDEFQSVGAPFDLEEEQVEYDEGEQGDNEETEQDENTEEEEMEQVEEQDETEERAQGTDEEDDHSDDGEGKQGEVEVEEQSDDEIEKQGEDMETEQDYDEEDKSDDEEGKEGEES